MNLNATVIKYFSAVPGDPPDIRDELDKGRVTLKQFGLWSIRTLLTFSFLPHASPSCVPQV